MITLYSGTPGSGKSLHIAERLYWKVRGDYPVIVNFPIATEKITKKEIKNFRYIDSSRLTPQYLIDFAQDYWKKENKPVKEETILCVIDEAQLLFNSRDYARADRKDWLKFFTLHRHLGYEMVLCCQFDRMLDRQIRCLIEYEYTHRKVKNFGWQGYILNLVMGGKMHVCEKQWYPLKERIGSQWFRAKKRYYRIYDTFLDFDALEQSGTDCDTHDGDLGAPSAGGDTDNFGESFKNPNTQKEKGVAHERKNNSKQRTLLRFVEGLHYFKQSSGK